MVGDPNDDLARLIQRALENEETAKTQIYRRYARFVERRFAEAKRRRNWFWLTDLSEAVQDVFVQFFKALSEGKFQFQHEQGLKGFLIQTSFFVAMNLKDRMPRERVFSQFEDADGESPLAGLIAVADEAYAHRERADCMKLFYAAVEKLKANRREVITRTLLGQKVRDICAATNKTPASISGLKHHALKDLRTILIRDGFLDQCQDALQILGGQLS